MFVSLPGEFSGTLPFNCDRFCITKTNIDVFVKDTRTMMELLGVMICIGRHDYKANLENIDAEWWREIARDNGLSLIITKPDNISLFEL